MSETRNVPKLPFVEVEFKPERVAAVAPHGAVQKVICGAGMHMPTFLSRLLENVSKETVSRITVVGKKLVAGVFDNGNMVGYTEIMPNIVDVKVIRENDTPKVVIVSFADGTKEKAVLDKNDTYSLEQGISICITKKLLGKETAYGSSLYNKVIKHAMNVMVANEKAAKEVKMAEERAKEKAAKMTEKERKRKAKRVASKREYEIGIHQEAYVRAIRQIQEENKEEMEKSLEEVGNLFAELLEACEEETSCEQVAEDKGDTAVQTVSEMNETQN